MLAVSSLGIKPAITVSADSCGKEAWLARNHLLREMDHKNLLFYIRLSKNVTLRK
jgi:hypothetical protein